MPSSSNVYPISSVNPKTPQSTPTPRVLRAALSGLMAAGAFGCSDSSDDATQAERSDESLTDDQLKAMCADMVADAKKSVQEGSADSSGSCAEPDLDKLCEGRVQEAKDNCATPSAKDVCKDMVAEATAACPDADKPDPASYCADTVKAAVAEATAPVPPEEKVTEAEQKEYTFAELTKMCDDRGGYVQVHASCGGVNTCKGFSYGDWGPGAATLTEHTCAGVNGCAGLSCVVLPGDKHADKTDAELYDFLFADTEPSSCTNCHASHEGDMPDISKFKVFVEEGSTRDAGNWLDRTAAEQERIVAFGAQSVLPDGTAMRNMAAYHGVLSRSEIERLVAHIRTLEPVIEVMKTKDPAASSSP